MKPAASERILSTRAVAIPGEQLVDRAATIIVAILLLLMASSVAAAALFTMNVTVTSTGELEPLSVWTVRPQEAGIVSSVLVATGEFVNRDAVLLTLDSAALVSHVRELETTLGEGFVATARRNVLRPIDLDVARERLRRASINVDRARTQLRQALIDHKGSFNVDSALQTPQSGQHIALDLGRAAVLEAETEVKLAQLEITRLLADSLDPVTARLSANKVSAQLSLARERLSRLRVRAPAAGIVVTDRLDMLPGRVVQEGEPILELASVRGWQAQFLVAETDIRRVEAEQTVRLEFVAMNREIGVSASGTVVSVGREPWRPAGSSGSPLDGSAPRYRVVVAVDPSDSTLVSLRRGFTVKAYIQVGRERVGSVMVKRIFGRKGG